MNNRFLNKINKFSLIVFTSRKGSFLVMVIGLFWLAITSSYVAYKSAVVHSNNNDQLIDGYMFESLKVFNEALFPAAHTFLLKWPLFTISALFDNTYWTYVVLTIGVMLLTVLGFIATIYLITRNKALTGVMAIVASSILLLVPAQPINAVLLPVNMGMITTRNVEFLVFFLFIFLVIKTTRINSASFYGALLTLVLLGATDKFFLMLALVAAVLKLFITVVRKESLSGTSFIPLVISFLGFVLTTISLVLINLSGITNVVNPTATAPFTLAKSIWQMLEGIAGAIEAIVVNFGADIFGRAATISLLPYMFNGLLMIACFYAAYKLLIQKPEELSSKDATSYQFVIWLILTAVAALIVFAVSDHGYEYDARYLTGSFFAGIASLAYVLNRLKPHDSAKLLLVLAVSSLAVAPLTVHVARKELNTAVFATQKEIGDRTSRAAQILQENNTKILMGDYWFVSPVKLKTDNLTIAPMSTEVCDSPNYFLTSEAWYEPGDARKRSALYILRDASENATTFNHGCTLQQLNEKYGSPVKEYVIRGTREVPIDILRIYNYDVRTKLDP